MSDEGPTVKDHLQMLGKFVRNPRTVGAVAPSSAALAREMVRYIGQRPGERIVELGPGTGSFTRVIMSHLSEGSRFIAVDVEPGFVDSLRRRWPAIDVVCGSAERLPEYVAERGLQPVDHIISGLPFASLPEAITRGILDGIEATLRPGGTFTTFQYVHAFRMPPGVTFRRDFTARMGSAPTRVLVMRNVPPAWAITWRRA